MSFDIKRKRRSGSTSRMLLDVCKDVHAGYYVFVFCGSKTSAEQLKIEFSSLISGDIAGNKVYPRAATGGSATFEILNDPSVLREGLPKGAHRSCRSYMDHHALESIAPWALFQWLKYNNIEGGY